MQKALAGFFLRGQILSKLILPATLTDFISVLKINVAICVSKCITQPIDTYNIMWYNKNSKKGVIRYEGLFYLSG